MMFKHLLCSAVLLAAFSAVQAQQKPINIDLWPSGLPNTNGIDNQPEDLRHNNFKPSIRIFLPDAKLATGRAVVACPGGGYGGLALDHEGYDWAPFFNNLGIAYIVLKYRMPHGNRLVPMSDAYEAIRVVRSHVKEWHINPDNIGIMGSSAGGHLASTVATHPVEGSQANFQILFYPVITMNARLTHAGSRANFLGADTTKENERLFSNELQVKAGSTPPAILLLSDDDNVVPVQNGVRYYLALKRAHIRAALHVYPSGGHGWGFHPNFTYHKAVLTDLTDWLHSF